MGRRAGKNVRIQERDEAIVALLFNCGVLSHAQIVNWWFEGNDGSWPRERLRQLEKIGLIHKLKGIEARSVPQGQSAYVLKKGGAAHVAGQRGVTLKDTGWKPYSRWSLVEHDLYVAHVYHAIQEAVALSPELDLYEWIPETEFRSSHDRIEYDDGNGTTKSRGLIPDGFIAIRRSGDEGRVEEFVYLLEVDMHTESNRRFAREKLIPGNLYIGSEAYQSRFHRRYGRWLVITKSEDHMRFLMEAALAVDAHKVFFFTTFHRLVEKDILRSPIWLQADREAPFALID